MNDIINKNKYLIMGIILVIVISIAGTFAWITWRSTRAAMVLTIGEIDKLQITLSPYELNLELAPVVTYTGEEYVSVKAMNNSSSQDKFNLYYEIESIDSALKSSNMKYAITRSNTENGTYTEIEQGNFLSAEANENLIILEETLPANTTYYYRVYAYYTGGTQGASIHMNLKADVNLGPKSFATDSWETIRDAVSSGTYPYQVGDTKCVALNGFTTTNNNGCSNGEFLVRVANTSTPSECNGTDFSQSACGFVVEFVDIITTHNMNPSGTYKGVEYSKGWNVDGWPATSMKAYIDSTIYNALPSDLQTSIITTKTISGHGNTSGETNFVSNDKLYLLAPREIYGTSFTSSSDTAKDLTHQLDYYAGLGVTTSNYSGAIKYRNGSKYEWWLRAAISSGSSNFYHVMTTGEWTHYSAYCAYGVAPAFRLA